MQTQWNGLTSGHFYEVLPEYMFRAFNDLEKAGYEITSVYTPMEFFNYQGEHYSNQCLMVRIEVDYIGCEESFQLNQHQSYRADFRDYPYYSITREPGTESCGSCLDRKTVHYDTRTVQHTQLKRGRYCVKVADKAYDYWCGLDHSGQTISQHIKTATFYAVHDSYFAIHLMQASVVWHRKPEDAQMYCSIFLLRLVRDIVDYYYDADMMQAVAIELMD